jgi:hypothetical protein
MQKVSLSFTTKHSLAKGTVDLLSFLNSRIKTINLSILWWEFIKETRIRATDFYSVTQEINSWIF